MTKRTRKASSNTPSDKAVDSVLFQVAGVYTHGKMKGKTNPKQTVDVRLYSKLGPDGPTETVREICNRLVRETRGDDGSGAFYRILEVSAPALSA